VVVALAGDDDSALAGCVTLGASGITLALILSSAARVAADAVTRAKAIAVASRKLTFMERSCDVVD
jgi:hypothetical protein